MSAPTRAPAPGHKRARSGWGGEVRASGRGGRWGNFGSPALSPPPDVLLTRRPWPYAHATHDPRVAALPEEWGGAPGTRIVDFGCGTGAALLAACARWPSAACLGIDICPRTIRRAKVMQCILEGQASQAAGRVDAVPDEHDLPMPWSAMQSAARGGASLRTAMRVAALAGAAHTLARAPCPQASAAIRSNMLPVSVTVEGEVAEPQRSARAAEGVGSRGGGTAALVDPSTTGSRSSNESRAPASMAIVTGVAAVGNDAVAAPTSSVSAEAPCASAPTLRPVFVCRDVVFSKIRCARGWYHLVFW
ncbi:hypothetical protein EON67_00970 [archaeon]|nr:MAG: hypothetical protein EON67_00970 [archaeon]